MGEKPAWLSEQCCLMGLNEVGAEESLDCYSCAAFLWLWTSYREQECSSWRAGVNGSTAGKWESGWSWHARSHRVPPVVKKAWVQTQLCSSFVVTRLIWMLPSRWQQPHEVCNKTTLYGLFKCKQLFSSPSTPKIWWRADPWDASVNASSVLSPFAIQVF